MKKIKLRFASLALALFLAFSPVATVLPMQTTTITVEAKSKSSNVYIAASGRGKCYHRSKTCSRMRGRVKKLSKSKAKKRGYRACKKCYK